MNRPLVLLVRDGWGIGPDYDGNAVLAAETPVTDRLRETYPMCTLAPSGEAVGLRPGSQGSSEVGHLNMGAGRIVEQEVVRVDKAIADGSLWRVERFAQAVAHCKETGATFHLMGLVQDQGVHATQDHLFAILRRLAGEGLTREQVAVHVFSDGRDTPPQSALDYLGELEKVMAECGVGRVASVMGRYWAMDRGENWDRTARAFQALTAGEGRAASSAREAIEQAYRRAEQQKAAGEDLVETDEFIRPTLIVGDDGTPISLIEPGDAALHTNYRQDRAIQLSKAFYEERFDEFDRGPRPDVIFMGLTRYWDEFDWYLVAPMNMEQLLAQVLADHGLRELRIAEYQKYKHVTSFFNGKVLEPFPGEDRIQVESITIPEDQKPEMSAYRVTELMLTAVTDGIAAARQAARDGEDSKLELGPELDDGPGRLDETYDVIVLNYANCDMVGHTGVFDAAVKAVETVDECVGKVVEAVLARGGICLVTADHGNAEQMTVPETGAIQTAHTTSPVECFFVSSDADRRGLVEHGKLSDLAVTMLELLGVAVPKEMTANSLLT